MPETTIFQKSELMEKLLREKRTAREFQERRHDAWNEVYELARNKIKTNRLTQRQAVIIPLMRETEKTLLSKIDDPPIIDWNELGGDEQKEIYLQEIWNDAFERGNFEGLDIQDKKNILRYGRGFRKLNWKDGVEVNVLDIFDLVIDPLINPLDIETARFIIHQNIFRSLREVLADERYTKEGKDKLKDWITTPEGMIQSASNKEEWEKKMERLKSMGIDSIEFPLFAAGDVLVNISEHYTNIWTGKKFERRVIEYADDATELLNEKLIDLIGVDFYPFTSWGEDVETNDVWNDGPLDLVRVPNKILNVWFSQLVENRTLRNFQMHWYDATIQGYTPQTYEPGPGRMLPAPGDPNRTIMPVNIQGLDETLTAIDFIIRLVERGTAATAIEKGVSEKKQITLGEVQLLVGKAMERTQAMAKFYRRAWQETSMKWYRIMDANHTKKMTLYKASRTGRIWQQVVYPQDWKSKEGYKVTVHSSSEQEEENLKGIQKWNYILGQFPDNLALRRIAQKRQLEIVDLTPEELREVEEEEKRKQRFLEQQVTLPQAGIAPQTQPTAQPQPLPEEAEELGAITRRLQQVSELS